jgi:protein-S-isoprenylcysteine O-methyltransferase Ste14
MNTETVFQIAFIALFVGFMGVRMYYHRRAGTVGESIDNGDANKLVPFLRKFAGVPWLIAMVMYMIMPSWMAWSALPLLDGVRWVGVGLGVLVIVLLLWIHRALDRNFSTVARIHEHHTLVTSGPYQWVRHPMYPTLWLFSLAAFLISANWFIGLPPLVIVTLIMFTRPEREEQQLIATFGDAYRNYMKHTGRFWPRVSRS